MLTYTHTYLVDLAVQKLQHRTAMPMPAELILGNVIPDFITHLGRERFQAMAHDLDRLVAIHPKSMLEWGAIFHILCDNYSTLGKIAFEGAYHRVPKNGFIERLSQRVTLNLSLEIPRRRILQIILDIEVIRANRSRLIAMLRSAASFLKENFSAITHRIAGIYQLDPKQLQIGLQRFLEIYGDNFIEQSALEEYRLFALARSLLDLPSLTDPKIILEGIRLHPELMELVESNMGLISNNWQAILDDMVLEVLEFPGMSAVFLEG